MTMHTETTLEINGEEYWIEIDAIARLDVTLSQIGGSSAWKNEFSEACNFITFQKFSTRGNFFVSVYCCLADVQAERNLPYFFTKKSFFFKISKT